MHSTAPTAAGSAEGFTPLWELRALGTMPGAMSRKHSTTRPKFTWSTCCVIQDQQSVVCNWVQPHMLPHDGCTIPSDPCPVQSSTGCKSLHMPWQHWRLKANSFMLYYSAEIRSFVAISVNFFIAYMDIFRGGNRFLHALIFSLCQILLPWSRQKLCTPPSCSETPYFTAASAVQLYQTYRKLLAKH